MRLLEYISLVLIAGLLTHLLYTQTVHTASPAVPTGSGTVPNQKTADYRLWGP